MAAPMDLRGARFGRLTVLAEAARERSRKRTWLARCDCGVEEVIPGRRLTQDAPRKPALRACSRCTAPRCRVCDAPILSGSRARRLCDDPACATEYQRAYWRTDYHRRAEAPEWRAARAEAVQERRSRAIEADPSYLEREAARKRRWAEANREQNRLWQRTHYAANREAILARRRARLDSLDIDAMERWLERTRAYGRAYRARWRASLMADPEAHRAYLDLMAEYRRRRRLSRMLAESQRLLERIDG